MPLTDVTAPAKQPQPCKAGRWINKLKPSEKAILDKWMANTSDWSVRAILAELNRQKMAPDFKHNTLQDHRNGDCGCFPK